MSKWGTKSLMLFAALLAFGSALAAEGRIPVFAPGTVIAADGKYIVTRDISAAAAPIVTILAGNVDLDLNGFTLSAPAGAGDVISIPGPIVEVRIHNGTLVGGSTSINATGAGRQLIVEDVKSQDPLGGLAALHTMDIQSVVFRRNNFEDSAAPWAISMDGVVPNKTGVIEGNVIRGGTGGGIQVVTTSAIQILHNRIEGIPGPGISFDGNGGLISENTVSRSGANGIEVRQGKGCKLFDNVVTGCTANGIVTGPATTNLLILNNVSTGNTGDGLQIQGAQHFVEGNTLNSNTSCGLRFFGPGGASTFGRNMARGNTGVGCAPCAGAPVLFFPNSCNNSPGNTTFGNNLIPGPPVF